MQSNRRNLLRTLALGAATLPAFAIGAAGSVPANSNASAPEMLKRKIPSSGEVLPVIGLGTWQTFDVGNDSAVRGGLENVLQEFAARGGTMIDSSPMYGRAEEVAGDLIAKLSLREKLFVATKVWTTGKAAGVTQMEASMKKLRTKSIDLMQVHNLLDVDSQLETLIDWKRQKLVRYIGVTHYTAGAYASVAKVIARHKVDFLQINYSVSERAAEDVLLPLARERGIAVIVNRPFAGGELLRRLRNVPLPVWAGDIDCASWAQLLLKFVISHPAITVAIPATARVDHLRDNMAAGVGRLPDEKMREKIVAAAA